MALEGIGLGDLILTTAQEIRKARDQSAKLGDPVLTLEGCELELKVTISAEGGAGIKVWLLDLSAKGNAERASTITLRFGPAPGPKPEVFFVDRAQIVSPPKNGDKIVPARRATRTKGSTK
jgi:NTP-dependent ternary system trypsin peptidase co-occuring protein